GYTLQVLDHHRQIVFERHNLPAPEFRATYKVTGGGGHVLIRRAAMNALTYVRGQEATTFKTLAHFIREDIDRDAAIQALERIPTTHWPADEARPLLESILAYIRKLPASERTSPTALEALQLGESLTSLVPQAEALRIRRELGELGVRIIRLGT